MAVCDDTRLDAVPFDAVPLERVLRAEVLAPAPRRLRSARTAVLTLEPTARAAARARQFVTEAAGIATPDDAVDALELLTSELVTNAVRHGGGSEAVTVSVTALPGRVRVAVHDCGEELPVVREPHPEELGGRGLRLVAMLADDWGVDPAAGGGKRVWFVVTVP